MQGDSLWFTDVGGLSNAACQAQLPLVMKLAERVPPRRTSQVLHHMRQTHLLHTV